jgi:ftsJ-like methyltransferase
MLNSCAKTLALPSVFLCPIVFADTKEKTIMMIDLCKIAAVKPYGSICKLAGKAWIPVKGFESHLDDELALQAHGLPERMWRFSSASEGHSDFKLNDSTVQSSKLVYCEGIEREVFWKQLCWEEPFVVRFRSIGEAAELLRAIQRNWAHYPLNCFRRAELIGAKLPYISKKEKQFPYAVPLADMGVWSLLDEHTLLASAKTSSPFPLGVIRFTEDHQNPPSRAYLKLWEALTLLDFYYRCAAAQRGTAVPSVIPVEWGLPQRGSHCVDAGACPGGWTWVLNNLGAEITAIDRSLLADFLMREPRITFMQHDAFTLTPESLGKQDWVCSDVICYPPRLLEWVERWRASGLCSKFICTIKMQGAPDFDTIRRFAEIPHSKIVHLTANKHELTWLCAPFIDE